MAKLTLAEIKSIIADVSAGMTHADVAEKYGISTKTVQRYVRDYKALVDIVKLQTSTEVTELLKAMYEKRLKIIRELLDKETKDMQPKELMMYEGKLLNYQQELEGWLEQKMRDPGSDEDEPDPETKETEKPSTEAVHGFAAKLSKDVQ